jgi:ComF family protein
MRPTIATFFTILFDAVVPPRRSDMLVRTLTLKDLHDLSQEDSLPALPAQAGQAGTLPYHNKHIRALIWEIKYRKNAHALNLAGEYLTEAVLGALADEVGIALLIPVPMHKKRRRERGHNQCETLCESLLAHFYDRELLEYRKDALVRTRHTLPQQALPQQKRLHNVAHSMQANAKVVSGRVCFIIDDVSTTGATLKEAQRALKKAGARQVFCLPLARVPYIE